jgi:hypothetical protein
MFAIYHDVSWKMVFKASLGKYGKALRIFSFCINQTLFLKFVIENPINYWFGFQLKTAN